MAVDRLTMAVDRLTGPFLAVGCIFSGQDYNKILTCLAVFNR